MMTINNNNNDCFFPVVNLEPPFNQLFIEHILSGTVSGAVTLNTGLYRGDFLSFP